MVSLPFLSAPVSDAVQTSVRLHGIQNNRNFVRCNYFVEVTEGTQGRGKKSVQGFDGKARRKETTRKTKA
jgi:hypothetical protein